MIHKDGSTFSRIGKLFEQVKEADALVAETVKAWPDCFCAYADRLVAREEAETRLSSITDKNVLQTFVFWRNIWNHTAMIQRQ